MTLMSDSRARRRLRAPAQHGTALIDPPLREAGRWLADNGQLIRGHQYDVQGRRLGHLRDQARRDLIEQARRFTLNYRDVDRPLDAPAGCPILLTGHQPQLFHPGVWFKSFALDHLGKSLAAQTVHLLIDNDTVRSVTIRVPAGSSARPWVENVAQDRPSEEVPFEERKVVDRALLASLDRRVAAVIEPLVRAPLIGRLWRPIHEICARTDNLGQCLAQARHILEGRLGLNTLELPLSWVCRAEPFHWFVAHLLARLPCFWDLHNSALLEYRRVNRVRSQTHPVPELTAADGWLEAPLWVWTTDAPQRRRVFARRRGDETELTDQRAFRVQLALCDESDADRAVEQLASLEQRGVKLRPRALITTMYARLLLGDLFLHGIGGAKYDELTDMIIRRFFQIEPPAFLTLSATVLLPIGLEPVDAEDLRSVERQLRELEYHPEEYLDEGCQADETVAALVAEKRRWVQLRPARGEGRRRRAEICRINGALQPYVETRRRQLRRQRQELAGKLRSKMILGSRQFSFCLYPEETLLPLLLELLDGESTL